MASYGIAKKKTARNEGLWADNPADSGGETWAGIARKSHPQWKGWSIIDGEKRVIGKAPAYTSSYYAAWVRKLNATLIKLPLLSKFTDDFYRANYWDAYRLNEVQNQDVADWMYDHVVNAGGRGAMWVQEALNHLGATLAVDGDLGIKSIAAINAAEPAALLEAMTDVAAYYRLDRAAANPSQIQFLPSWLRRDGVTGEEIQEVMKAARDGLTYAEVAELKRLISCA